MEIIDIYDRDHRRTGRTMVRGEAVQDGDFYLVAHLCVFDGHGRMLIQQRQKTKKIMPGMWDVSAGGFMKSGEDSREGLLREAGEELGLKAGADELRFLRTEIFRCVLDDFYLMRRPVDIAVLRLQEAELQAVRWESEENILGMIDGGSFVDYDKALIHECFTVCC